MPAARLVIAVLLIAALALPGCGGSGGGSSSTAGSTATGPTGAARRRAEAARAAENAPYAGTRRLPFAATPLSAAQRSRLAKTGRVTLPVHVDSAGRVSAFGQAELEGTIRKIAHAAPVRASGAGTVDLKLRLTPLAHRYLAGGAGRSVLMYVGIFFSKSRSAQRLAVPLEG